jgi:N-acetylglucosaminyldiphosphoundecaprenol N-acetyl-beta-D-mannosaminyltransferase
MDLPFDNLTMDQTISQCLFWCDNNIKNKTLVTVNVAHLMMMRKDFELKNAIYSGDVIVADGQPIVWASHLLGTPLPERVAGIDLMTNLLDQGDKNGLRIYLLGAKQEVLDKLSILIQEKYPGIILCGMRNGYFDEAQEKLIVEEISTHSPDILLIGMPSPFKETWAEKHRNELNSSIIIGVGGSFDVLAGFVKRAPQWMQKIGMEWFWRLLMEPRKLWKRYLINNTYFIYRLCIEIIYNKTNK